jgi:hypothetical protein
VCWRGGDVVVHPVHVAARWTKIARLRSLRRHVGHLNAWFVRECLAEGLVVLGDRLLVMESCVGFTESRLGAVLVRLGAVLVYRTNTAPITHQYMGALVRYWSGLVRYFGG